VLSFSLQSPLTEPPSVIDVAYWQARNGPPAMSDLSPLSGAKLTSDFGAVRAAFDPTETSNLIAPEAGWVPFLTRRPIAKC
jgi:hypothetical protein